MTDNQARFIARDMCAPDHEHCVDISPILQVVTIGAAELEALRQQAARVPALEAQVARIPELEAQVARIPELEAQVARIPELEAQVARLENDMWLGYAQPAAKPQRVRLAEIERIATKLRAKRARIFMNCAAEFASMKRLYSMR